MSRQADRNSGAALAPSQAPAQAKPAAGPAPVSHHPFAPLIAAAPFPAFLLVGNRVAAANALAQPILAAFAADATWGDTPIARIAQLAAGGRPAQTRIGVRKSSDPMAPPLSYDVTMLPVGDAAFVTARDVTFDVNLAKALTQSRSLYRDLIDCSADFAFETDTTGAFSFVSPRGALGFAASALHGRRAADLTCHDGKPSPFAASAPQDNVEVIVADAGGEKRTLVITSRPVRDEAGVLRHVRGVARDVTAERAQLQALEAAHAGLAGLLERETRTDTQTGLFNARGFGEEVDRRLDHLRRMHGTAALLCLECNLDGDKGGLPDPEATSRLATAIGGMLRGTGRPADIAVHAGGGAFALFLEGADASGALMRAGRIGPGMMAHLALPDTVTVRTAIGIAIFDGRHPETRDALTARAQDALREAKSLGQDRIALAEPFGPHEPCKDVPC